MQQQQGLESTHLHDVQFAFQFIVIRIPIQLLSELFHLCRTFLHLRIELVHLLDVRLLQLGGMSFLALE